MENTVANMNYQQMNGFDDAPSDDGNGVEVVDLSGIGANASDNQTGVQGNSNPDAVNPTGAADQTMLNNQQQIDRAIAKRLQAERKKYAGDISLSGNIRGLFNGKTDEEIMEKLKGFAANDYATERNIPVPVAEEVMGMRMNNRPVVTQQTENTNVSPDIQAIADEAKAIEAKYGVNLVQMIADSPDLQHRVFGQGEHLKDILIEHLQANQPQRKTFSPMASPNGMGTAQQAMTDEEYRRITEQVHMGKKVRR